MCSSTLFHSILFSKDFLQKRLDQDLPVGKKPKTLKTINAINVIYAICENIFLNHVVTHYG